MSYKAFVFEVGKGWGWGLDYTVFSLVHLNQHLVNDVYLSIVSIFDCFFDSIIND